jgi:hypothetical protein
MLETVGELSFGVQDRGFGVKKMEISVPRGLDRPKAGSRIKTCVGVGGVAQVVECLLGSPKNK